MLAHTTLVAQNPEDLFQNGLMHLQRHRQRHALESFRRALELAPNEPRFMSFFGLCIATNERRLGEGLELCETAVRKEFFRPELFVNLGRLYLISGDVGRAHQTFRRGLAVDQSNEELRYELRRLGTRRQPVLPSLGRSHPVNVALGRLLHKLSK